jgi:hypothetical protein
MLPKKGIVFPKGEKPGSYAAAIACVLSAQLGATHQAVKVIMRWTGAGERTVKNWLSGISGPNGQHLIELIRHSDHVLEVVLTLSDRQQCMAMQSLVDVRNTLAKTVEQLDGLMEIESRDK